ncbi:MAG TPA: zinc-dependent metalloprotease [Gemmatimonadales bacterium]|nr:zinc-dependent metalloprotease [Gemmatimonadales bacterium]
MTSRTLPAALLGALFLVGASNLDAQRPGGPPPPPQPPSGEGQGPGNGARGQQPQGPKPYAQVVTDKAVSDTGVFIVHRIGDQLLFEIPRAQLGKPFLLVGDMAGAQDGTGYAGVVTVSRVIRWERMGNRVLLRNVGYDVVADSTSPVSRAVRLNNVEPIIMAFDVAAYSADSNPVLDVGKLFTTDVPELSVTRGGGFGARPDRSRRFDTARSLIAATKAFPANLNVRALHTWSSDSVPNDRSLGTITEVVQYSMVALPDQPASRRLCDNRVGFFSTEQVDYGTSEQRAAHRCYIDRWRLEPKDPGAAVSDPVKPIVFYIDPATPAQWVPWLIKGVEDWQPAFRYAGFSNAIVARRAPTAQEDPNFSMDDARYSYVRWLPSTIENAFGPHVSDPRTGEILQSSIGYFHNVMNLLRDWYFVQVGPVDPRAATLPLPDSLMGRMLEYVVAHEVGHTLGFPHNFHASATMPVDSLRSPSYTARWGDTPSIMDYARFNYVAQPGDGAALIPTISVYDSFAVNWGYRQAPGATTPESERPFLDSLARQQDQNPMLRFGDLDGIDPNSQREAVGDDPVRASTFGMMNLKRVMGMLLGATTANKLEDYSDLSEMYDRVIGQWRFEMSDVVTMIGGVYRDEKYPSQAGVIHAPVPRAQQAAAMRFLAENVLATPLWMYDPQILRRIEPTGFEERMRTAQTAFLRMLFDDARLARLADQMATATPAAPAYGIGDLLGDVRRASFSELAAPSVAVDAYRRNLQRAFVDLMNEKLNPAPAAARPAGPLPPNFTPPPPMPGDARALIRAELVDLDGALRLALPKAANRETRAHIADLRYRIDRALNPKA